MVRSQNEQHLPLSLTPEKDGRVGFVSDFRKSNDALIRKPWPIPDVTKISEDTGKHAHVSALDLSMGYCHFAPDEESSKESCAIALIWGKHECKLLPVGLHLHPDCFQQHHEVDHSVLSKGCVVTQMTC